MLTRRIRLLLALIAALEFFCTASSVMSFAEQASTFDTPLKKNVVDFGRSEYAPASRIKLWCYLYPRLLVKEYDDGGIKGAVWVALVPLEERSSPKCTREHVSGERLIEWRGLGGFLGIKQNLVFVCGADGQDGGMPFAVFDSSTGKKLFQDVAYDSGFLRRHPPESPFNRLRVHAAQGGWSLEYLRVVAFDCDLHKERTACWEHVKEKLTMQNSRAPDCTGYQGIPTRWPSAVAYPVEVSLFPQPATKTIAGPIRCWPVD